MLKQVVPQIEFDFTRNTDHNPAGQKLENTLHAGHRHQQQRIGKQLMACNAEMQVINGSADYLREENPDSVIAEDADRSPNVSPPVFLKIWK